MTSNSANFMKEACEIIKSAVTDSQKAMDASKADRDAAMWNATVNLMCHAALNVFHKGYGKKIAAVFTKELSDASGLSLKQSFKYTSAISAAFGVRGVRDGLKAGGIKGLMAAAMDGSEDLRKFLNDYDEKPINSLGRLIAVMREDVDKIDRMAEALLKFDDEDRDAVYRAVKEKIAGLEKAKATAAAKAKVAGDKARKNGALHVAA